VPATGCPLGGLVGEHRKGRHLVDELVTAVEAYACDADAARERVAGSLQALKELYATHIWKEDNLLFPLADRTLPGSEADRLAVEFRRVEANIGEQRLIELTEFAAQLQDNAGA
jgi:hemerythrin-like domain-containing protein